MTLFRQYSDARLAKQKKHVRANHVKRCYYICISKLYVALLRARELKPVVPLDDAAGGYVALSRVRELKLHLLDGIVFMPASRSCERVS